MECVSINSRLISSATYYRGAQKLRVWFHSGRSTFHENISSGVFDNLVSAESPGLYYRNYIAGRVVARGRKSIGIWKLGASVAVAIAILGASGLYSPKSLDPVAFASVQE